MFPIFFQTLPLATIITIIVLAIFFNILQLSLAIDNNDDDGQQTTSSLSNTNVHNITKRSSSSSLSLSNDQNENVKLICYYSNWAIYRPGVARFTPQNINPFLCVSTALHDNCNMNVNVKKINDLNKI